MAIQTIPANMIGTSPPANAGAVSPGVPIYEAPTTLSSNYCVTTGTNAITKSPFNIANGVTLTIPDGSTWVVI